MTKEEYQTKNFEQPTQEQLADVLSALNMLAVAVAALPSAELLIGDPASGSAAFLKVTLEKGLTVRYKPGDDSQEQESESGNDKPKTEMYAVVVKPSNKSSQK